MTGAALTEVLMSLGHHQALLVAAILAATFVLEDAAVVAAALLAEQGWVDPLAAVAVLCLGTMLGDLGLHFTGRCARHHGWVARQCQRPAFLHAAEWVKRRRWYALILARFVPGLRLPTYLASGLFEFPPLGCGLVIGTATLLWTPALFLASLFGWSLVAKKLTWIVAMLVMSLALVVCLRSRAPRRAHTRSTKLDLAAGISSPPLQRHRN